MSEYLKTPLYECLIERTQHPTLLSSVNCLVFGKSGCGKSSFINSLFSDMDFVRKIAIARGNKFGQQTVDYTPHSFTRSIRFFDPWGWAGEGHKIYPLKEMLRANVREGQKCDEKIENCEREDWRLIDIVLFIIEACDKDNITILQRMKRYVDMVREENLPFICVVTKMDLAEKCDILLERNPKEALTQVAFGKTFKGIRKLIVESIQDHTAAVIPMVNYGNEEYTPNRIVDFFVRNFVRNFVKTIEKHQKQKNKETPKFDFFSGEEIVHGDYEQIIGDMQKEFKRPLTCFTGRQDPRNFFFRNKFFVRIKLDKVDYRLFACTTYARDEVTLQRKDEVIVCCWNPENEVCFECLRVGEEDTISKLYGIANSLKKPKYEFISRSLTDSSQFFHHKMTKFLVIKIQEPGVAGHLILERRDLSRKHQKTGKVEIVDSIGHFHLHMEQGIQNQKIKVGSEVHQNKSLQQFLQNSREDLKDDIRASVHKVREDFTRKLDQVNEEMKLLMEQQINELQLKLLQKIPPPQPVSPDIDYEDWKMQILRECSQLYSLKTEIESIEMKIHMVMESQQKSDQKVKEVVMIFNERLSESEKRVDATEEKIVKMEKEFSEKLEESNKRSEETTLNFEKKLLQIEEDMRKELTVQLKEQAQMIRRLNLIVEDLSKRIPPKVVSPPPPPPPVHHNSGPSFSYDCFCVTCGGRIKGMRYFMNTRKIIQIEEVNFCERCFLNRVDMRMQYEFDGYLVFNPEGSIVREIKPKYREKYKNQIMDLIEFGFLDVEKITKLLVENDGDLNIVLDELRRT